MLLEEQGSARHAPLPVSISEATSAHGSASSPVGGPSSLCSWLRLKPLGVRTVRAQLSADDCDASVTHKFPRAGRRDSTEGSRPAFKEGITASQVYCRLIIFKKDSKFHGSLVR